jgi:hypothetical protein
MQPKDRRRRRRVPRAADSRAANSHPKKKAMEAWAFGQLHIHNGTMATVTNDDTSPRADQGQPRGNDRRPDDAAFVAHRAGTDMRQLCDRGRYIDTADATRSVGAAIFPRDSAAYLQASAGHFARLTPDDRSRPLRRFRPDSGFSCGNTTGSGVLRLPGAAGLYFSLSFPQLPATLS